MFGSWKLVCIFSVRCKFAIIMELRCIRAVIVIITINSLLKQPEHNNVSMTLLRRCKIVKNISTILCLKKRYKIGKKKSWRSQFYIKVTPCLRMMIRRRIHPLKYFCLKCHDIVWIEISKNTFPVWSLSLSERFLIFYFAFNRCHAKCVIGFSLLFFLVTQTAFKLLNFSLCMV